MWLVAVAVIGLMVVLVGLRSVRGEQRRAFTALAERQARRAERHGNTPVRSAAERGSTRRRRRRARLVSTADAPEVAAVARPSTTAASQIPLPRRDEDQAEAAAESHPTVIDARTRWAREDVLAEQATAAETAARAVGAHLDLRRAPAGQTPPTEPEALRKAE